MSERKVERSEESRRTNIRKEEREGERKKEKVGTKEVKKEGMEGKNGMEEKRTAN